MVPQAQVPLVTDGFTPLTDEDIEAIPDVWTAQQKQLLVITWTPKVCRILTLLIHFGGLRRIFDLFLRSS